MEPSPRRTVALLVSCAAGAAPSAAGVVLVALAAACADAPTAVAAAATEVVGVTRPAELAPTRGEDRAPDLTPSVAAGVAAVVVSPAQDVVVALGDGGRADGRFHSTFQIVSAGRDHGRARLVYEVPDAGPGRTRATLVVVFSRGEVVGTEDGLVVRFAGQGELCAGPGGGCRSLPMTGTIRPEPLLPSDCLIYDFVGPNVHVVLEATGRIVIPGGR
jgi:hypothetical protein